MPGDADGSGAACVATPPSHYACAHGQRMRAWHLLTGSPSLSGLSCQQTQQARISTGVTRHASRGGRHGVGVRTLLHRRVASAEAQRVSSHSAGACGRRVRAPAAHPQVGMAEGGEPAPPTSQTPSESLRPSEPVPPVEAQSAMQPLQPPVHPGQMVGAGSHALPPQSQMNLQPLQAQAPPPPSGGPRMLQPPPPAMQQRPLQPLQPLQPLGGPPVPGCLPAPLSGPAPAPANPPPASAAIEQAMARPGTWQRG